jgi:N-acyl-D-amino-acid deacylase
MMGLEAMKERGRMQTGMVADIVVFDPQTIAETSSMKAGERGSYTKGIPHVLVNGEIVIKDGVANTSLRAGMPIRYEPITAGKIVLEYDDEAFQWNAGLAGRDALSPRDWPASQE